MNGFADSLLAYRQNAEYLAVDATLLCLCSTFLLSHAISWVYLRTSRGVSYSGTMARSLIVLSLIVALVMLVVGNNMARAFGLFGALALIRFRTPVKDANDTVFLFFAVAVGIATGSGNILAGVIGTVTICAVLFYLSNSRFGNPMHHDGLLRFRMPPGDPGRDAVGDVLKRYCDSFSLLHIREIDGDPMLEMSYQVKMFDTNLSSHLISEIKQIQSVNHLTLLMQDAEAAP